VSTPAAADTCSLPGGWPPPAGRFPSLPQCLGYGVGLVKVFQSTYFDRYGDGTNSLASGYSHGTGLGIEIIGTFMLVYTVFSATDPKHSARDSHVPMST